MKNFNYIEHIINNVVTDKAKLQFIGHLINDPELRKQYRQYIHIAEEIEQQENIIESVNQDLTGYAFIIKDIANLPDRLGYQSDDSGIDEVSLIIRTVIEEHKPSKPPGKNGWIRAAAVFLIGFQIFISVSSSVTIALHCCNPIEMVI